MKKDNKLYLFLVCMLFSAFSQKAQAQFVLTANPDNAFIQPEVLVFTSIDVLANDYYNFGQPNDCNKSGLEIKLFNGTTWVTTPVVGSLGRARVTADNQVEYMPLPGKFGQERVKYQIHCPSSGETSQAEIYVNVNDKPDMISDADCYVDPVGISFKMKEIGASPLANVTPAATAIVGDVDNDGMIEMFIFRDQTGKVSGTDLMPNQLLAFRYNTNTSQVEAVPEYTINLFNHNTFKYARGTYSSPYVMAKVDGNEFASIFVALENMLVKYDLVAGAYKETARTQYALSKTTGKPHFQYNSVAPIILDIMGSGRTQICIADEVFDTKTLKLLAKGYMIPEPTSQVVNGRWIGAVDYNYGMGRCGAGSGGFEGAMMPGDIDGDGIQELVGGDCVYKINLVDFDNKVAGNTFKLAMRAEKRAGLTSIGDGATALVDIDLDGQLEVVVAGPLNNHFEQAMANSGTLGAYVYNPRTGKVIHNNYPTFTRFKKSQGPSRLFVGDIDGDGFPEICFITYNLLVALQMDNGTNHVPGTLGTKWTYAVNDESSSTTLSMFDFTQSGKARLVYRDQNSLRIIDGSGSAPVQDARFMTVSSGTANEFPVVADVNNDGAAEIIVAGGYTYVGDPETGPPGAWVGHLRVFAADISGGGKLWAPARNLWHQPTYNPLYVNDDLTIPQRPINLQTEFVSPDGRIDRPFNGILQQSTSLNKEGLMIMLGPDLAFDPRVPKRLKFNEGANSLDITVGVLNQGDAVFTGPISLQLYAYTEATDTYEKVGAAYSYPNAAGLSANVPNNTQALSYTIPNISSVLPASYDNLVMTVNLNSNPKHLPMFDGSVECHGGYNNFASGFSLVDGERVICEGDTETVNLNGVGGYTIKWFAQATGGTRIHTGSSMAVTKNADPVTHYFVEAYNTPTSPNPITNLRDTVFVYLAPDTLVWTGNSTSSDWHNWQNWRDPSETLSPKALIPRGCTNVQIPSGITLYPNLANSATNYNEYAASECNNIHFAHGGEVVRPDMLLYSKAFVDVTLDSHRWQMFAPPLKDFYTGDIYRNDIIPFNDDIKAYTKYWARRNPMTSYYTAGWTGLFNQPDQSFEAGQALGVWISDKSINGQVNPPRDPFEFSFPKYDTTYRIYQEDTNIPEPSLPVYNTPRNNHHRFIFDGATAGANFNLKIDGESKSIGQMVLVGNPFMAHLDFDKFYLANSAWIQNYYTIQDENAVQQHYNKDVTSTLSKNIAPMQAFLVEVKAPFTNLIANGQMTLSVPGDKLKSEMEENPDEFVLRITATQAGFTHNTQLLFSNEASNKYKAGEDIAALFPTKATSDSRSLMLYSQSTDGVKVAVNVLDAQEINNLEIPLGIWSPKGAESKSTMINVSNLNLLPNGVSAYLYDKKKNKMYDLSLNSMVTFDEISTDSKLFMDDRIVLKFKKVETSIEEQRFDDDIDVTVKNSILNIVAPQDVSKIEVYNLQGKLISSKKVDAQYFITALPYEKLYIIRIYREDGVVVKKVLNL